jgi:hypothetical protein
MPRRHAGDSSYKALKDNLGNRSLQYPRHAEVAHEVQPIYQA